MSTVLRNAPRKSVTQPPTKLWTSKEGEASARRKCLKEHHCRLVSMNIWCLQPWVQDCSTLFNVELTPHLLMWVWADFLKPLSSRRVVTLFVSCRKVFKKGATYFEVSYYLSTPLIETIGAPADWNGFLKADVTGRVVRIWHTRGKGA